MESNPDPEGLAPADEAPAEQPPVGEDVCPRCEGSGVVDGDPCPDCQGRGTILTGVGGG
jgi:RecJ-like exonuclease